MTARSLLSTVVSLILLAITASASHAGERVMVLIEEHIGDAKTSTSLAEIRMSERLIAAGQEVVEAVETDKARTTISIDKLLGGAVGAEVTALNCDVLVVGRTSTVSEEIPYGVQGMSAVSTEWTVRAIGVDTGRVLAASSGRTSGAGTQIQSAAGEGRKKAADAMFEAIQKAIGSSDAPANAVSLTISGLQELKNVETLKASLGKLDGVRKVTVRFVTGDETRIDIEVQDLDTWGLAGALRGIGLEVSQLSRGAVRAIWTPWGAGKKLAVAAIHNRSGIDRHDWIEAMLPEVFATELANSRYLRVVPLKAPPSGIDDSDAAAIAKAAKDAGADYIAVGELELVGNALRLSLTVYGETGASVTAAQVFAGEPELVGKTRDLVWAVDQRLFEKLFAKGALATYQPAFGKTAAPAPGAPAGKPDKQSARVKVVEVKLDDIYPARLAAYATRPVGKVVLANPGATPIGGVRVQVDLPGITGSPAVLRVEDLAPGAQREVPVMLVLDRAKVQAIAENTPVQAEIRVTWATGGDTEGADLFTVPVVVFDKNALDWSEPESIAAFTTHKDPNLDAFAREAERQARPSLAATHEGLRPAHYLFEALGAAGIQYQADPRNPFGVTRLDAAAFPSETLGRKAGDCDDLSVLMAALLESQGVATTFVLTPGHILVAFDSGVAFGDAPRLGLPATVPIDRSGRAWIPLEVTRVGGSFSDALLAGAAEVQRHRDTAGALQYVDVAEAWKKHPPFPGSFPKLDVKLAALPERMQASAKQLVALANDLQNLPEPATSDDPNELNRIAVLLVQRGQWRRATAYLERARQLDGKRKDLEYNVANLKVVEGQRAEARAMYEALKDVPALASHSLHALGVLAYLDGQTKEAKSLFERSGLPEAKDALVRLGLAETARPEAPKRTPKPGAKKPVPPPPDPFLGIRAGVQRVPLDELLLWLR